MGEIPVVIDIEHVSGPGIPSPAENALDAIRAHRGTRTPREWSDADRRLYSVLPEVNA